MQRRTFLLGAGGALAGGALAGAAMPRFAWANVPKPYSWDIAPPLDNREAYIGWMVANRGEDPRFLSHRWSRYQALVHNKDVLDDRNKRAFLLTPREEFVLQRNLGRAYDHAFLDIGYGVTISGPHVVSRMTSNSTSSSARRCSRSAPAPATSRPISPTSPTRSGPIEIIKPLAERTRGVYDALIARGYTEYQAINSKNADGYYGWEEAAPFDKIIVTCGIDHIPPPLLQQLKVGGIMVIPVGPPGAQHVLKVMKDQAQDGTLTVARSDIYNGRIVPFVPFTKLEGDAIKGTHNNPK